MAIETTTHPAHILQEAAWAEENAWFVREGAAYLRRARRAPTVEQVAKSASTRTGRSIDREFLPHLELLLRLEFPDEARTMYLIEDREHHEERPREAKRQVWEATPAARRELERRKRQTGRRRPRKPDAEPERPGQRYVERRTGRELERNTEAAIRHKPGQTLVFRGLRYVVAAVEDGGDTVLLDRA